LLAGWDRIHFYLNATLPMCVADCSHAGIGYTCKRAARVQPELRIARRLGSDTVVSTRGLPLMRCVALSVACASG
jgi:hypothetical protein